MNVLGVSLVYNEADFVTHPVMCLLGVADEVHVFDHGSTDGTGAISERLGATVHKIDRRRSNLDRCWRSISDYIMYRSSQFDLVVWLSGDEILCQPDGSIIDKQGLEREWERGIRVICPRVFEYWITDSDSDDPEPMLRLRHYRERLKRAPCPRVWEARLTRRMPFGLHRQHHQWGITVSAISRSQWVLHHYPIRSMEQGRRKIMSERPRRQHYAQYQDAQCRNLVRSAASLKESS